MRQPLPKPLKKFEKTYPEVWQAFSQLGEKCHESGGPLDEKTRRLVKLALAIGTRHEGAVHSAVRQALQAGLGRAEMMHVAILAITTAGWPAAFAAMTWIEETLEANRSKSTR
jgi:alkylhydroperoxidase/carboxymuconolactone decarboxylase family protein YurZ